MNVYSHHLSYRFYYVFIFFISPSAGKLRKITLYYFIFRCLINFVLIFLSFHFYRKLPVVPAGSILNVFIPELLERTVSVPASGHALPFRCSQHSVTRFRFRFRKAAQEEESMLPPDHPFIPHPPGMQARVPGMRHAPPFFQ